MRLYSGRGFRDYRLLAIDPLVYETEKQKWECEVAQRMIARSEAAGDNGAVEDKDSELPDEGDDVGDARDGVECADEAAEEEGAKHLAHGEKKKRLRSREKAKLQHKKNQQAKRNKSRSPAPAPARVAAHVASHDEHRG